MPSQVGIREMRLAAGRKTIRYAQNDEASALAGVEDARAVGKAAGLVAQVAHLMVAKIEDLDRIDGFGNFLSVSADVLHRRAANGAGDAAQAFDPGIIS